jgi:competence protein ComEA
MLLLAVVSILFGIRVALARSSAAPQPVAVSATGRPGGLVSRTVPAAFASTEPPATLAGAQATTAGVMVVHVVGQVRHEGVVRLPAGSRVLDAVRAAGGAKPSADLDHLNLARVVADGEQLVVPKPGETLSSASGSAGAGPASGASSGSGAGSTGGASAQALVDLNTADAAGLDSLPGVGPVLSQRILDWRGAHGRFSTVDELGEVSGIGEKLLAQIGPKVKV